MLKSETERVIRRAIEESGAQFTDEQIEALCLIFLKITQTSIEEAFANWRPSGGGGRNQY
jgi:hypothetical protein